MAEDESQARAASLESRVSSLFACLCAASAAPAGAGGSATSPEGRTIRSDAAAAGNRAAASRELLAELASVFSPRYECQPRLVTVDLRGLDRLFGTPRAIGEAIQREALSRGVSVHVAVAATQSAAQIMAVSRPGLTVIEGGREALALASMPLAVLLQIDMIDAAAAGKAVAGASTVVSVCERWGVRTLGEFVALPAAGVVSRLGAIGRVWQGLARGEDRRPLVPTLPEERFEGTVDLEWPIEGLEPLSFVLTRLLEPLSIRLERADRGAARLHLQLRLVSRDDHLRCIDLPAPMREVRALRTLLLLDLESHPPETAIDRVTLVIDPTPGRILQHTLFSRPHPTPEQLSTLLARLGALIGQQRVGTAKIVDAHRPGAFEMAPFALVHRHDAGVRRAPAPLSTSSQQPSASHPAPRTSHSSAGLPDARSSGPLVSALRRYRHPVPARVVVNDGGRPLRVTTDRRGLSGGGVVSSAGPWRTSGAWWEDDAASTTPGKTSRSEAGWDRDEWDVALSDRVLYRIFQDRVSKAWFVDAVVD